MGITVNAHLIFGIDLGEIGEKDFPFEIPDYFYDYDPDLGDIAAFLGLWENIYPPECDPLNNEKKWSKYDSKCVELFNKYDFLAIYTHCTSDYPRYILGLQNESYMAYLGSPTTITPEQLQVDKIKLNKFKAFLQYKGITTEPKWILCSYYSH